MLFTATECESVTQEQLFSQLGQPRIGDLTREDGEKPEEDIPLYLVGQASPLRGSDEEVRIIDFGSGMYHNSPCVPLLLADTKSFLS